MGAFDEILKLLQGAGAEHHVMEHEPVRTSAQAAQVRGTELGQGAKALVLECGDSLLMAVISAAKQVDFRALKRELGEKRVQMASPEKVMQATGCEPGGVPPFGHLFGLRVILDPALLEYEWIDFNAGERTRSVEMRATDYLRLSGAEVVSFAK
ncbi:MAG: YbaK/EbsC family protein [Acidobacteriota bacterium]|nr:YbaK/EbsC family protein [Acidobacteriota bacterium]